MTTAPRQSSLSARLWRGVPVALVVLLAVGYVIGSALAETQPAGDSIVTPYGWVPAVFLFGQAAILLARYRAPLPTLLAVTALDAVAMLTTSSEFGTGSLAVMIAVYSFTRVRRAPRHYLVTGAAAIVSIAVTLLASQPSADLSAEWVLPFAVLRGLLVFGLPIVVAEVVDGRARLVEALRERADAAERERDRRAEEAVQRERALMARELHDIAAHHLTGIIVSAQAADALIARDADRAADYLHSVQRDARTTLSNLRQAVGLLRTESPDELAPVPSIEQLPALVAESSTPGADVRLTETGTPVALGPLAGLAAYRMAQESLANALRHAPGADREVEVEYGKTSVRITVRNGPDPRERPAAHPRREGYGLLGMAERAELIGATLQTGPAPDGGWVNTLTIPYEGDES